MEQNLLMPCYHLPFPQHSKIPQAASSQVPLPSALLPALALHSPGSITGETAKKLRGKPSFPSQELTRFCLLPAIVDCCLLGEGWTRLRVIITAFALGKQEVCKCSVAFPLAMFLSSSRP